MEDRFLNPLGFQVISYRRDTESVGIAPPSLIQSGPSPNVVTLAPPVRTQARPAYVSPGAAELGPNTPALSRPPFIGPMPK
jgi:hypothetical protein